jgi:hypothetical protein
LTFALLARSRLLRRHAALLLLHQETAIGFESDKQLGAKRLYNQLIQPTTNTSKPA